MTHSTVSVEENRGTDQRLIRGLVARDPGAAEELISRYGRVMFSLSCRIAKDPFLAEDAVQDACLQVWRDAVQYDAARGSVQAWLLVITRARTLDRLRARQRRDGCVRAGFDADTASGSECPADVALERRDRLGAVGAVMDLLPGPDRLAVELAYYEGLTHTEIAHRLDLPLGTAKTQIRRAMQTLRAAADDRPRRPFQWRAAAGPAPPSKPLENVNVLVVDDELDTVKLTTLVLARAGASVIGASSTVQALERLAAWWPDVALIDLEMPERDGYDLMARLRGVCERDGRRLPAIAFTANGRERDRRQAQMAGFALLLAKPIHPSSLVESVARVA